MVADANVHFLTRINTMFRVETFCLTGVHDEVKNERIT